MKRLAFTPDALRTLDRMPVNVSIRIQAKLASYVAEPEALANNVIALKGAEGLLRMRVGNWRVLFTDAGQVVQVVKIAPRGSVYEKL